MLHFAHKQFKLCDLSIELRTLPEQIAELLTRFVRPALEFGLKYTGGNLRQPNRCGGNCSPSSRPSDLAGLLHLSSLGVGNAGVAGTVKTGWALPNSAKILSISS